MDAPPVHNAAGQTRRRSLPVLGGLVTSARPIPSPQPGQPPVSRTPPPPRSVRISVTDRCDFACTYCRPSHHDGYAEGRLMAPAWATMFEALRSAGVRRVRLTGGEPLIHADIVSIVRHLS